MCKNIMYAIIALSISSFSTNTQNIKSDTGDSFNNQRNNISVKQSGSPNCENIRLLLLNKLKRKIELTDKNYQSISRFLLKNKNEAMSEEIGYLLFKVLKRDSKTNNNYLSFLTKKGNKYKELILSNLIQIMCIDLGESEYTYRKLINDFVIFKGSMSAEKTFNSCVVDK